MYFNFNLRYWKGNNHFSQNTIENHDKKTVSREHGNNPFC